MHEDDKLMIKEFGKALGRFVLLTSLAIGSAIAVKLAIKYIM